MNRTSVWCSIALAVIAMAFSACTEETTTPQNTTSKNYLPLTVGNYWIYERKTVDTTGTKVDPTETDSAVVTRTLQLGGKDATEIVYITTKGTTKNDTTYFSKSTDGSIYTWLDVDISAFKQYVPNLTVPKVWVQVKNADNGAATWTALDTLLKDVPFSYLGQNYKLDVKFTISGKKGTSSTVSVGGKSYTAQEFVGDFKATGALAGVGTVLASYSTPQHSWFIENVGLFTSRTDVSLFTNPGGTIKVAGTESLLTSFSLK